MVVTEERAHEAATPFADGNRRNCCLILLHGESGKSDGNYLSPPWLKWFKGKRMKRRERYCRNKTLN